MLGHFVKTSDEETARRLREAGFVELAKEDSKWVFLNEGGKLNFEENKDLKITYNDMLCV